MDRCWYTKTVLDYNPKGLVHLYQRGDASLCGKKFNYMWFVSNKQIEVTCIKCMEIYTKMENENHGNIE